MAITRPSPIDHLLAVANTYHEPEARDIGSSEGVHWVPAHDHLDTVDSALEWFGRMRVRVPGALQPRHLARLRRIREAVRALPLSLRLYKRRTDDLLRNVRFTLDSRGTLVSDRDGWDAFIDGLLPALVEVREQAGRLKVCENPQCRWLFLDHSRNRSRQWCEAASCGNRQRVRRFRLRLHARPA